MYQTKRQDPVKVFDSFGIEPEFWRVFPNAADIEGKDFLDFSFKQRVWLLKTVCDTAMVLILTLIRYVYLFFLYSLSPLSNKAHEENHPRRDG